jgi:hypothetical protein
LDPPNDAFVVRGGEMLSADLNLAAEKCLAEYGRYGISVWSQAGRTVQEIAELGGIPNTFVRLCTAGELRQRGFPLTKTGGQGHYTLFFEDAPNEATWSALRAVLSRRERNLSAPQRGSRGL